MIFGAFHPLPGLQSQKRGRIRLEKADRLKRALAAKAPLPQAVGAVYAMAVLFWLPLYLCNGYVHLVDGKAILFYLLTACAAVGVPLCAAAHGCRPKPRRDAGAALLLGLCAVYGVNTLLAADHAVAFWGMTGRDNGFLMLLACAAGYCIVRAAVRREDVPALIAAFLAGACVAAAVGWLNFFLCDPFDAYYTVDAEDAHVFLSTVGNINFFGALMAAAACAALAACLRAPRRRAAALYGAAAVLLISALIPANSDGAWVGFAAALLCLLCQRGLRGRQLSALFCVGAAVFAAALLAGALSRAVPVRGPLRTLSALVCHPAVCLVGAPVCLVLARALRRCTLELCGAFRILAALAVLAAAALAVWANLAPQAGGPLAELLRFGPRWGSNRGYVWGRLLYLYGNELTPLQRLIGTGGDSVNALLNPHYTIYIVAMNGSTFDSAHNVYLQHLLCGGCLGAFFWCAFWAVQVRQSLARRSVLAFSLIAYCVQAFFSIDMPGVLAPVFILAALAQAPCAEGAQTPCAADAQAPGAEGAQAPDGRALLRVALAALLAGAVCTPFVAPLLRLLP